MRVSCNFSRKPIQWNIDKHICCGWMFCSCSPLPFDISKTIPCSYGQPQGKDIMQVPKRANSCRQWIYPLISMAVNLWGKWFWNHTNLMVKLGAWIVVYCWVCKWYGIKQPRCMLFKSGVRLLPEIFSWSCQVSKSCPVWDNDSNLPILLDTLGMGWNYQLHIFMAFVAPVRCAGRVRSSQRSAVSLDANGCGRRACTCACNFNNIYLIRIIMYHPAMQHA